MTVRFYKNFSKRKNSTKRPANTDTYDEKDCRLKDDTSIINPSLVISNTQASASGNPVTVDSAAGNMINPVVTFNPVQTGTGTPSPLNPRPIVPYTSINVDVNGNATVIDLQGNKYGGVLDIATGVLTVKYAIVDLGDIYWTAAANGGTNVPAYTISPTLASQIKAFPNNVLSTAVCEQFDTVTGNQVYLGADMCVAINVNGYILMYNTNITGFTGPQIQAALAGIKICYELATYQTIQLTPAQVALVAGSNTVSVNGNSSIAFNYFREKIDLDYTYVYIPDFNRYYFVSNVVVLSNNRVQYILEADVLASFKTNIGSTVARIAFAATGWDKDIPDPRCTVKSTKLKYEASQSTELTSNGCYILTVFNQDNGASNGLGATYVLDAANMQKVKNWMGDDTVYQALLNYFNGSPMESIFACTWVPFSYAANPGAAISVLHIGNQDSTLFGISGYIISGTGILSGTEIQITIPYRYNDFRDSAPYTDAQLYLPGIGNVDININDFLDSTKIHILYTMEYGTGDLTYYIKDDGGKLIQTASCNVASQCPLGQLNINGGGMVSSIGSAVGGAAALAVGGMAGNAGVAIGGAGALLASVANTVLSYNKRSSSLKGNLGGRTSTEIRDIIFTGYYMDTEDVDAANYIAVKGRPVAVSHAISNHSGFIQCDDASVAIAGSALERQRVNDYLNSGFFYE